MSFLEMEHNITEILQPGGRAPLRADRGGSHQGVHKPDAVYGTSGAGQEATVDGVWKRLQHSGWHR